VKAANDAHKHSVLISSQPEESVKIGNVVPQRIGSIGRNQFASDVGRNQWSCL